MQTSEKRAMVYTHTHKHTYTHTHTITPLTPSQGLGGSWSLQGQERQESEGKISGCEAVLLSLVPGHDLTLLAMARVGNL